MQDTTCTSTRISNNVGVDSDANANADVDVPIQDLVRIRAVTAFITLCPNDFESSTDNDDNSQTTSRNGIYTKISKAKQILSKAESTLSSAGYEVQTVRIATNPFGEYLAPSESESQLLLLKQQLSEINSILKEHAIDFFAIGPAKTPQEVHSCPIIVASSHRISCSAAMRSGNDIVMAEKAAECMKIISQLGIDDGNNDNTNDNNDHVKDGLGNFRFCATACCKPYTPFFPAGMGTSLSSLSSEQQAVVEQGEEQIPFAIGLENGKLAKMILQKTGTIDKISTYFKNEMTNALHPIQTLCESITTTTQSKYVGMDTSLNPSLEYNGSVAEAIEQINTVKQFGGPGSIAVAAEITHALKTLPNILKVGYCGLMLPVCEDRKLAYLASTSPSREIDTTRLLAISSVCGVGLDTIPVPDCGVESLTGLILDVASLSFRYEKSLSCRLLICPGSKEGDRTTFNSPYMCECKIFNV